MRFVGKAFLLSLFTLCCIQFGWGGSEKALESFEKAKKAFEPEKQLSSFKKLTTSLTVGANLAKAVFSLVKLIKTFTGDNESKELKFLKEQFNIVNTKMDALDYEFAEVKDLIDWSVAKVNFGAYERRILATERILSDYVGSPLAARKIFEDIFKINFELHNGDAALKLYYGLVNDNQIFGENLFNVARKFYGNDRLKVAEFGAYVCRIIQRGINHEAAFMLFKGRQDHLDNFIDGWEKRFTTIKRFAAKIDEEIVKSWPQQSWIDADKMTVRTAGGLSAQQLAQNLHKMLDNKFPWRAWVVVVFPNRKNDDAVWKYENCGKQKYEKFNVGSKIVLINSGDAANPPSFTAAQTLGQLSGTLSQTTSTNIRKASYVFDRINSRSCNSHVFKAVFEESAQPSAIGPKDHFATKKVVVEQRYPRRNNRGMITVYRKTFWVVLSR